MCYCCYGNLKFPKIYNGKSESRPLFLSDYRYFDNSFTVMFLEHMNLVQTAELELPWQTKCYFFFHAIYTVFWLNIAFISVHSAERCGPWASGLKISFTIQLLRLSLVRPFGLNSATPTIFLYCITDILSGQLYKGGRLN